MNLYQKLALLTDAEVELCLNGLLKGLTVSEARFEQLLASPKDMSTVIRSVASEMGESLRQVREIAPAERPGAIRLILVEIAENPALSPRLEAWFRTARPKLLEPVTSAVVLAGIILALSTHVEFDYEASNGKKRLKVKVEKRPTALKILEKFWQFFH